MKKISLFVWTLIMGFLGMTQDLNGQTKVFDQTITWEHAPYDNGGYGFYWWHRTDGTTIINYGDMPSDNWASPNNYYDGEFTMSVEVISQPTDDPFWLQFGIWSDYWKAGAHTETVAERLYVNGGNGSTGSWSLGSPSGWWNKQPGDPLDFSRADDFYRIGVVLWNTDPLCIPMGQEWSSVGCPEYGDNFFPLTVRISVYASSGPYVPPAEPLNYGIDYWGERTNKVISTDDQYSYESNFSTVVDGNGQYLSLTPGTNIYFRKKSDFSKTQALTVPYRPGAPGFTIDYANQRTSETVSDAYQFSANSNMSSSTNGDGSYVGLTPGANKYFRKQATGSAFASNIQSLIVPGRPNAPLFGIDYLNERTTYLVSDDYQYSSNSNMSNAIIGDGSHVNLTPGANKYFRKLATSSSFASSIQELIVPGRPGAPTFGIDYPNERTSNVVNNDHQYSTNIDMSNATIGDGSYVYLTSGANRYFKKLATSSAFSSSVQELIVPGRPGAPSFGIDYSNERTSNVVSSEYQYSNNSDMSSPTPGDGSFVGLTPGSMRYFRKLAGSSSFASSVQELVVPIRPTAPTFGLDYDNQRTFEPVGSEYEYSSYSNMSYATIGDGSYVSLTPGSNMYFRKRAGSSTFASNIQELIVPASPAAPNYSIDYVNERTDKVVSTDDQYSYNNDFSSVLDGDDQYLNLTPGTNVYFRKRIDHSKTQTLTVPHRPTSPSFGIDYSNERTSTTVSNDYLYSPNSDMNPSLVGDGSNVKLSPGSNIFFIKLATSSNFTSDKQTLTVPDRPEAPSFSIDYPNERISTMVSSEYQYSSNSDMSFPTSGDGSYVELTPGSNRYFRKLAGSSEFASIIQELIVSARPTAPSFGIDFPNEMTSTTVSNVYQHSAFSNMSSPTTGDGSNVVLVPGSYRYFRKLGSGSAFASNIQELIVPLRPAPPAFEIDFSNERTNIGVESEHEYATLADMSDATSGTGDYVPIRPGSTRYFRIKATSLAFHSSIQTLIVPARPTAPSFMIDFMKEQISTLIEAEFNYSYNSDMSEAAVGSNNELQVNPGVDIYFQAIATPLAFASEIQTLVSPFRPGAPTVGINFINEATDRPINSDLQYSSSSEFESAANGTGVALNIVPGVNLYFRSGATSLSYSSEIYQLNVPPRPVISSSESDSTELNPFMLDIAFFQELETLDISKVSVINAELKEFDVKSSSISETVFEGKVIASANDVISIGVPANVVEGGNFISDNFEIYYTGLLSGVGIESAQLSSFTVFPNPGKGIFYLKIDNSKSHSIYRVECFNITGEVVHAETFFGLDVMCLDLADLSEGIYLLRLSEGEQITGVSKLVIY